MSRMVATVIISLLKVCFLWAATIVIVKWTISQEHLIHLLGIVVLGGGAIVVSTMLTIRIGKSIRQRFFLR